MEKALIEYGFNENQIKQLLKGKTVNAMFGTVKINKAKNWNSYCTPRRSKRDRRTDSSLESKCTKDNQKIV